MSLAVKEQISGPRPYFSVILPVWNRRDVVRRSLDSVFAQDFQDYEIMAVDDGSTDDSVAVMRTYTDPRLKIIVHPENRGVCAARGTAAAAARGRWHLPIDTDWTLLPGAMKRMAELAEQVPSDVGRVSTRARNDKGEIWPIVPMPQGLFGLAEYLQWYERSGFRPCDCLSIFRAKVFETFPWPTDRRLEWQLILRTVNRWRFWVGTDVLACIYTDCTNRIMTDRSEAGIERQLRSASDQATMHEEILDEFGMQFKKFAPTRYWWLLRSASDYNFMAGRRSAGLRFALKAIAAKPWGVGVLGTALIGLLGPGAIKRVRGWKWLRRAVRTLSCRS